DVQSISTVLGDAPQRLGKFGVADSRAFGYRLARSIGEPGGKRHAGFGGTGKASSQVRRDGKAFVGEFDGALEKCAPWQSAIAPVHEFEHPERAGSANGRPTVRKSRRTAESRIICFRRAGQSVERPDPSFLRVAVKRNRAAAQTGRLRLNNAKHHLGRNSR